MYYESVDSRFHAALWSCSLWHQLSLNLLHGFLSNFGSCFPWAICPDVFGIKKWFLDFLRMIFVFINMGPYGSKKFKTLLLPQITFEFFQTFLKFLLSCPHKSTGLNFWNFEFLIFHDFSSFSLQWDGVKFGSRGCVFSVYRVFCHLSD